MYFRQKTVFSNKNRPPAKMTVSNNCFGGSQALVAWNYPPPPFLTFCFHIYFQYNFFIISSLFPRFNLFVSIFKQSYVNSNLNVSTLNILIIQKARNSENLKIVHLLASGTFNAPYFHYVIQTWTCQFIKDVPFHPYSCLCMR